MLPHSHTRRKSAHAHFIACVYVFMPYAHVFVHRSSPKFLWLFMQIATYLPDQLINEGLGKRGGSRAKNFGFLDLKMDLLAKNKDRTSGLFFS